MAVDSPRALRKSHQSNAERDSLENGGKWLGVAAGKETRATAGAAFCVTGRGESEHSGLRL
jgi:hypothetical protein